MGASFLVEVKDGGVTDYYWKPLCLGWLLFTALVSFGPDSPARSRLAKIWWLQPLAPVVLLVASIGLTSVHAPR
jgi:hypothetical protein